MENEEIYTRLLPFAGSAMRSWEEQQEPTSVFPRCRSLSDYPVAILPAHRLDIWRQRLQAIELFALLRVVDPAGWAHVLGRSGFDHNMARCVRDREVPTYDIQFEADESVEFMDSVLSLVLTPHKHDQLALEVRSRILAMATDPDVRDMVGRMRIPVRVVDVGTRMETAALVHRWFQRTSSSTSLFELTGVVVQLYGRSFSPAVMGNVDRYMSTGLPLDHLTLTVPRQGAFPSRIEWSHFLQRVVSSHGARRIECDVLGNRLTREVFFSALTDPRATGPRSLAFSNMGAHGSATELRSHLMWVLYGLFSQDARHSIGTLRFPIYNGYESQDLEWLHRLLQQQAAPRMELLIPEVFDEYVSLEPPTSDRWVYVPRGFPIRLDAQDQDVDGQSQLLRFDEEKPFRVIRDDPTRRFIDILVPGYGRCWVERSEDMSIIDHPLTRWRFEQHAVESLEVTLYHCTDQEQRAVVAFLRLVGGPVKTLRIYRVWREDERPDGLNKDVVASILKSCPRMERLILHGLAPVNSSALVGAFEDQTVPLQGLGFESQPFEDRLEMVCFMEALCDRTLALTRNLRELALNLHHYETPGDDVVDVVEAMLHMLETNQYLPVVYVGLSATQHARYAARFHAQHGRALWVRKAPLPMPAKCALLSALGTVAVPDVQESAVLALVFAFAAECATRSVTVGICSPDRLISGR